MLFATAKQGHLWLWMMACGAVMGLWYLLMAALRRFVQAGFLLTLIADICFGLGCGAIFFAFLVAGNYGQFRLFTLVAALLGAIVFALAVSAPLSWIQKRLKTALGKIWTWLSGKGLIKVIFK